jgi:CRISPR/Cas system-associated protein Csm6
MAWGLVQDSLGYFVPTDEWMSGRNNDYEESVATSESAGDRLRDILLSLVQDEPSRMAAAAAEIPTKNSSNSRHNSNRTMSAAATIVGDALREEVLTAARAEAADSVWVVARLLSRLDEAEG